MSAFLWFLAGMWVGVGAGFLLFACLQVSRDAERAAETPLNSVYSGVELQIHASDGFPTRPRDLSPSELAFIAAEIEKIKSLAATDESARELL